MKRLIFFIFTIICSMILYTCVSPLAVEDLPSSAISTFYSSKPVMSSGGNSTYLGVTVNRTSITIGFVNGNATPPNVGTTGDQINSAGTNTISGTYPNISFQDGVMSGTIRFMNDDQLKITFQQRIYPYLKMWDVVCEKNNP